MNLDTVSVGGAARVGTPRDRGHINRVLVALVALEIVALYAPTCKWLFERWTMGVWNNGHGFLIPPAVAFFCWHELKPLRSAPRESSAWGLLFLIPALAIQVLDTGIGTQILSAASLVLALPGLSLLFLGPRRTAAIAFPLTFTLFMLPLPLAMTERIHLVLREIATAGVGYVLPLLGMTVYAEHTTLEFAGFTLSIGDACSGFSTLYAAIAVAALTAYSSNTLRGRILALSIAAPLAIASNIVRIILLTFIVQARGLEVLDTWIHPASGVLTFVLTLPVILWAGAPRPARTAQ